MFPVEPIQETHKLHMRHLLEPTEEMKLFLQTTLDNLFLRPREYAVIHVRSGDGYLNKTINLFSQKYIQQLSLCLSDFLLNETKEKLTCLLLADNNEIKHQLAELFPRLMILCHPITHLGEGVVLQTENVRNTMLDFYLLACASSIFAVSNSRHGSGFSYWCAVTFDIPYKCKYLKSN
jgi:hypothetical protein